MLYGAALEILLVREQMSELHGGRGGYEIIFIVARPKGEALEPPDTRPEKR